MGTPFYTRTADAQTALTEFSNAAAMALTQGPVDQWARRLGFYRTVSRAAIKSTYPIPVSAAGYQEFKGNVRYRRLSEKSISLLHKTWQDGVEELADVVEAPDWVGWMDEPARIAQAGMSLPNEIIAAALEANATHPLDNVAFFSDSHPVNIFDPSKGTFDNDVDGSGAEVDDTSPSIDNLKIAKAKFRSIKAPNGKPMGLRMTHVLVPGAQEETWRDLLDRDLQIAAIGTAFGAVDNRHKGTVELVVSDELTDEQVWYPMALNKSGMFPWILEDEGMPEELRNDKSSGFYKDTLKISIAYIMRGNGGLALPHCMQRWAGTEET